MNIKDQKGQLIATRSMKMLEMIGKEDDSNKNSNDALRNWINQCGDVTKK